VITTNWGALLAPLFLCLFFSIHASPIFIIVPGTWSSHSAWHTIGGDFFSALQISAEQFNHDVVSFSWSGKNNHKERVRAAKQLAELIDRYDEVNLVAHSHGTNVAILACNIITKCKMHCFFAFGTPVNSDDYFPPMHYINYFYNFFSFADIIQPVFGGFERVYPSHERIYNISVTINGKEPSHSELHAPTIARWLPFFHELFHRSANITDAIAHFSDEKLLQFEIDYEREQLLAEDLYYQQLMATGFGRTNGNQKNRRI
jgi:hypothetical protein